MKLNELLKDFELTNNCKVLYLTKSGSKLYGTDTKDSDTDYKGIFVPNKIDVLLKKDLECFVNNTNTKDKNTSEDIDLTLHSLFNFIDCLSKSETGSVDLLYSMFRKDTIVYENEEFTSYMKEHHLKFQNKNMKSFIGYALGQTKKFGIKGARYEELDVFVNFCNNITTNENLSNYFELFNEFINDNNFKYIKFIEAPGPRGNGDYKDITYITVLGKMFEGRVKFDYFLEKITDLYNQFGNRTKTVAETVSKTDFKALSHALRVSEEVRELLETNFINFPLKNANYLRDVKLGKIDTEEVINLIETNLNVVDNLLLTSKLSEITDITIKENTILKFLLKDN